MGVLFFLVVAMLFGLIAVGGCFGFLTALYALRPAVLETLLLLPTPLAGIASTADHARGMTLRLLSGLVLAIGLPLTAALAYALSNASWLIGLIGAIGERLWIWVAGSFVIGFLLGALLREPSGKMRVP